MLTNIPIEECDNFSNLIDISISDVQNLLKEDVDINNNQLTLTYLCAAICCYKIILADSINEPINIKKLNVSVKSNNNNKIKNAMMIKNEAIFSAKHLLKDNDFIFERMI